MKKDDWMIKPQAAFLMILLTLALVSLEHSWAQEPQGGGAVPISPKRIFDYNGDGAPEDVLVDIAHDISQSVNGKVQIVSAGGSVVATLISPHASDMFGAAVAPLGNIDGVAGDEIAISAPLGLDSAAGSGIVYIFGNSSGEPIATLQRAGPGVFGVGLQYHRTEIGDSTTDLLVVLADPVHDIADYSAGDDNFYIWKSFRLDTGEAVESGLVTDYPDDADWGDTWTLRSGLRSDITVDGLIDSDDILALESLYGMLPSHGNVFVRGDLNRDGNVDASDMAILVQDMQEGTAPSPGLTRGLPWKNLIKRARGVGKTVGFFALVRAGACIAAVDGVVITCLLSTDTDEEYVGCLCLTLADPGSLGLVCQIAFLGYDLVSAVHDYIGCPGIR